MITKLIGFNLLTICFLHGLFASGFIPILNLELREHASLAFSIYFAGIFIGQVLIFSLKKLSRHKASYPIYEILFSFTLIYMGYNLTQSGLIFGRLAEGLFAGMALPLLFALLVKLDDFMKLGSRIAAFNSVFSLGFVLGTPIIEFSIHHTEIQNLLISFGALLIALSLIFACTPWSVQLNSTAPDWRELLRVEVFKERFLSLFLAKTYYGLILALLSAQAFPAMEAYRLSTIIILIAAVFIIGQIFSVPLQRYYPKEHVMHLAPIFISFGLLGMSFTHLFLPFIIFTSLFHSLLLFTALKSLGEMPTGARGFALYNAITDLGLVLGGLFSLSLSLGLPIFLVLCTLPILLFLFSNPSKVRAERFYPFIGPLLFYKVFKRQKSPLLENYDADLSILKFAHKSEHNSRVKILLAGDLCPSPTLYKFSPALLEFINQHDQLLINLEGSQMDETYSNKNKKLNFDIPDEQFEALLSDVTIPLSFSLINNHCFDRGVDTFEHTANKLKERFAIITSRPANLALKNFKLSTLALSYGVNTPWRSHPDAFFIRPEQLLDTSHPKTVKLNSLIREAKSNDCFFLLSYHWGYECEAFPSALQQECAKKLHQLGVDLIWGHHCHIPQPFSIVQGKACLYSLGNLISEMNQAVYRQGIFYSVSLSEEGVQSISPHFFELEQEKALISPIKAQDLANYQNLKKLF